MEQTEKKFPYADILYMPHHESTKRAHMTREDRAAQFAPFAALTGHQSALQETARLTSTEIILAEDAKEQLNEKYNVLKSLVGSEKTVRLVCFVPDVSKNGGSYQTYSGRVRKIDEVYRVLQFQDKREILLDHIIDIQL